MREKVPHFLCARLAIVGVMTIASVFAQDDATLEKRGGSLLTTNCSRCHAIGRAGASRRMPQFNQ